MTRRPPRERRESVDPPSAAGRVDGRPGDGSGARSGDRAVSDLVGFVLIFGLVVSIVAIVSVVGLDSLESARDAERTNNVERAFEVLSNNVDDVAARGAPSRATEISLDGSPVVVDDPIQVRIRDPNNSDTSFLVNRTFKPRPIIYDGGDAKLVYVMGAVFRVEDEGGVVLEPWEPVLDEKRTFFSVINTKSGTDDVQSVQSSTVLVRTVATQRVVELADETTDYDDVFIEVTSPRRDLWLRMLEANSELSCSTTGPETVRCDLGYTPERIYVVDHRIAVTVET